MRRERVRLYRVWGDRVRLYRVWGDRVRLYRVWGERESKIVYTQGRDS